MIVYEDVGVKMDGPTVINTTFIYNKNRPPDTATTTPPPTTTTTLGYDDKQNSCTRYLSTTQNVL